jgi:2-oxoglutarate dehydrogenase E2 component (dihydrolipoamide succinyltransferase)
MPAARELLQEHGLRAEDIEATGPDGRLLQEDVVAYLAKRRAEPQPGTGAEDRSKKSGRERAHSRRAASEPSSAGPETGADQNRPATPKILGSRSFAV